jgi:hypothetical protein
LPAKSAQDRGGLARKPEFELIFDADFPVPAIRDTLSLHATKPGLTIQ